MGDDKKGFIRMLRAEEITEEDREVFLKRGPSVTEYISPLVGAGRFIAARIYVIVPVREDDNGALLCTYGVVSVMMDPGLRVILDAAPQCTLVDNSEGTIEIQTKKAMH